MKPAVPLASLPGCLLIDISDFIYFLPLLTYLSQGFHISINDNHYPPAPLLKPFIWIFLILLSHPALYQTRSKPWPSCHQNTPQIHPPLSRWPTHLVRTPCFLMCTVEVSSEPISPFLLHLIQSAHRSPSNCFKMWIKLLPKCTSGKEPACQCRRCKRYVFNTWIRKIPWSRTWQPTPVLLARESYGQRSLAGYSPWGRKGSDTTEVT